MTNIRNEVVKNRRDDGSFPDGQEQFRARRAVSRSAHAADQIRTAFNGRIQAQANAELAQVIAESNNTFAEFVQALQDTKQADLPKQAESVPEKESTPADNYPLNPHAALGGIEQATDALALHPDIVPAIIPEEILNQFADNPDGLMNWVVEEASKTSGIAVEDLEIEIKKAEGEDDEGTELTAPADESAHEAPKKKSGFKGKVVRAILYLKTMIILAGCVMGPILASETPPPTATTITIDNENEDPTAEVSAPESVESPTALPPTPVPPATPTEIPPTATATEIPPTPEAPVVPNFVSAIAEARVNPELAAFGAAFDNLESFASETPPFTLSATVKTADGITYTYEIKDKAQISFEQRSGRLIAPLRFENVPEQLEMQWIPFNKPGVETKGFWAVTQFESPLMSVSLGSAMDKQSEYFNKRGMHNPPSQTYSYSSIDFGANVTASSMRESERIGSSPESLQAYLRGIEADEMMRWKYPDAPIIYESLDDPNIDPVAMLEGPVFHLHANALWGTNFASDEQVKDVHDFFYNTATDEQKERIYNAPNYAGERGSNILRTSFPGSASFPGGFWDLTNDGTPPVRAISRALPEIGEPTRQLDTVQYPSTPALDSYSFDGERIVFLLGGRNDWRHLYLVVIPNTARGLGQEPNAIHPYDEKTKYEPAYYFVQNHLRYVFVTNSQGQIVIAELSAFSATTK